MAVSGKRDDSVASRPTEYTIHELAAETGTTVRNIRAYRNRKLLPAPERRGKMGIYSELHAARLRIINELLQRGYTISNIEELLIAWQAGENLDSILGIETALLKPFSSESPAHFTLPELRNMFGEQLTPAVMDRALALQLLRPQDGQFIAPRPTMIHVGATLVDLGLPLLDLLKIVGNLRSHLQAAANSTVSIVAGDLFDSPTHGGQSQRPQLEEIIWRLRGLVDRVVISEMGWVLDLAIRHNLGERIKLMSLTPATGADATR